MTIYRAKVTSKGQVTLPADLRRILELEPGAYIAFEVSGDYAVLRRARPTVEIVQQLADGARDARSRYASDDEAIAAYFSDAETAEEELGEKLLSLRVARSLTEDA